MSEVGNYGQQTPTDSNSQFANIAFLIQQMLGHVRTSVPVKVLAVHGGGVGPAPTVDVQVMVKQMDGSGNASSHSTIFNIPVARNQGGANAIINDPKVGDIGHMVVSDRDISSVQANNGAESNPGSFRRHDLADGVYHSAMLNPANPSQYIIFTATGVSIVDMNGNMIVMGPGKITVTTTTLVVNGAITATGNITAGFGGSSVDVLNHTHGGITSGSNHTATPDVGT